MEGSKYVNVDGFGQVNPIAVTATGGASEAHLGKVTGVKTYAVARFTRPGNATAYSANDIVNNSTTEPAPLTFADMGRINAGYGYITAASISHEVVSITPRLRLHLWNVTPAGLASYTVPNDNVAIALTYALTNIDSYLGFIEFPAMDSNGQTDFSRAQLQNVGKLLDFKCAAADNDLFGLIQTLDAFTPGNAKGFTVKLWGESY